MFLSGETAGAQSCVNITIIKDDVKEEKEYFNIDLVSNLAGVRVITARSTIEIDDSSGGQ